MKLSPFRAAAVALAVGSPLVCLAEDYWSSWTGQSTTFDSNLRLKQSGRDTDLLFKNVDWVGDSFIGSPYYGLRFTRIEDGKDWGWCAEFLHYKAIANADQTLPVVGTENGKPVNETRRLGQTIQRLRMANGVNNLMVSLVGRKAFGGDAKHPQGRWNVYAGVGGGPVWIFRAAMVNNEYEDGYQYVTLGYQVFGGAEYRLNDRMGIMIEGKYTNIGVKIGVVDGDIMTRLTTKHINVGFTYRQ